MRIGTIWPNITIAVVSTYLSLIAVQFGIIKYEQMAAERMRTAWVPTIACDEEEHLRFEPFETMGPGLVRQKHVGWVLNPKVAGANPKGYLGDCRPYKKPVDTKRVILLGDSFTGATQVPYDQTFASIMEAYLNKHSGAEASEAIEVINLGVGGYGTDQEYLTLISEGRKYDPDLIIHVIFLGNDIRDNSYALYKHVEWPVHWPHPVKPTFVLDSNGGLLKRDADLDYYYELNLAEYFGHDVWEFDVGGMTLQAVFEYRDGGIRGELRNNETKELYGRVVGVEFFKGSDKLTLEISNGRQLLHVMNLGSDYMRGSVGESGEEWRAKKVRRSVDDTAKRWINTRNYFLLEPLASFAKKQVLSNYRLTNILMNRGLIDMHDVPAFHLLGHQGDYNVDYGIYFEEYVEEAWDEAWKVTFALIKQMREISENVLQVPYIVVTIPAIESVYPKVWSLAQAAYPVLKNETHRMDISKPTRVLDRFLERENITHLSLYEPILADYEENESMLYDLGHAHLNANGHSFVAERIIEFLGGVNKALSK